MTIMRANEFEKGVSEKMGEFRLQPSAPVWPEVERRIRERKRRRILFFWFSLAGIILAGLGGWWIMDNSKQPVSGSINQAATETTAGNNKQEKTGNKTGSVSNHPDSENKTVTGKATTNTATETASATLTATPSAGITKPVPATNTKKINGIQAPALSEIKPGKSVKQSNTYPSNNITSAITGGNSGKSKRAGNKPTANTKKAAKPEPVTETAVVAQIAAVPPVVEQPTVINKNEVDKNATVVDITNKAVIPADTVKAIAVVQQDPLPGSPTKKSSKQPKWQTGVQFGFGQSRLTRGGFNIFSEKSYDALQAGGSVNNNPGTGNVYSLNYADSVPLKGPAFQAGVYAKRKLGKRTAFSAGVNLSYYSGKQRVGVFVDSVRRISSFTTDTREGFYRAGSSSRFNNRYYYFQFPLLIHWQLNKGHKIPPVQWENGIAPTFMAGSRALVYDRVNRVYFRDKSVYSSFGLIFQTGLTAEFGTAKKHPLSAGLFYKYHFSRLQKINPPDFNYLSSYGIQLRWLIKK
jgi:hypothetical protein